MLPNLDISNHNSNKGQFDMTKESKIYFIYLIRNNIKIKISIIKIFYINLK